METYSLRLLCIRNRRDLLSPKDLSLILFEFVFDRDMIWLDCESIMYFNTFQNDIEHRSCMHYIIRNWKLTQWDNIAPAPVTSLRWQTGTITIYRVCVRFLFLIFILHTVFGLWFAYDAKVSAYVFVIAVFFKWKMDRNSGNAVNLRCHCKWLLQFRCQYLLITYICYRFVLTCRHIYGQELNESKAILFFVVFGFDMKINEWIKFKVVSIKAHRIFNPLYEN